MGKIVYHGTFSERPPHEYGETFHAGTRNSTEDRLEDAINDTPDGTGGIWTVHGYEIGDTAPMSKVLREDPMFSKTPGMAVPEDRTDKVYPYTNVREDRGSTSYVIPSNFVGGAVKHLGRQFGGPVGMLGGDIVNAYSVMSGGPHETDLYL